MPAQQRDPRLIMVTSALPGDGKTFTSINLAFSMARERDISVLLVDADLLKPHVSKIFGLQQAPGLTDALVDETVSIESLVVATNVRGFSILPAGAPTEGTAELLSSNRMRQIVTSLCTQNPRRIVLLDSPPLLITSEGPALAHIAGQVVLVVRAGQTPQRAVLDAIGLIDTQRAGGIVLNEAHVGVTHGYYGYGIVRNVWRCRFAETLDSLVLSIFSILAHIPASPGRDSALCRARRDGRSTARSPGSPASRI